MKEKGSVARIDGKYVWVLPVEISSCINCENITCRKDGKIFKAVNVNDLPLTEGSLVRISAPAGKQVLQTILAVGVPVAVAVIAYIITSFFAPAGGLGIGVALAALCAAAAAVFLLSSRYSSSSYPVVAEIITGETDEMVCADC